MPSSRWIVTITGCSFIVTVQAPNAPCRQTNRNSAVGRAGAKALLGGTIAMLGSSYVLTLNAQDCVDGKVIAEEQVQAASKETVLAAVKFAEESPELPIEKLYDYVYFNGAKS